ncbi:MAG TPA: GNAT family N-acetyltransferase [Paenibacillus sp.]|uniref:GNAT family N-acetyltransferase n=1 Tax=Paenibacillus sp. TaxID=58172 RepID=UPI0028D13E31|nr:GNAT family N-acetyltransferase [Paenibacillus sp.]HUC93510.1 GNAT family N-acetyltransferase [Paenibacillus sp.]
MDTIVVKRASLKEVDYVNDLFDQYRISGRRCTATLPGRDDLEEMLEGRGYIVLVAVKPYRGVLHYLGYAQLSPVVSASGEKDWGLGELFVLPEAQHNGVEKALLAAVMNYTKRKDALELLSEAASHSDAIKELYESKEYAGNA